MSESEYQLKPKVGIQPVVHIVSFHYKETRVVPAIISRFNALLEECRLDNGTGPTYITSIIGGSNISTEKYTKGLQQTWVVTLPSPTIRDYFVLYDPAHRLFKEFVKPFLEDQFVFEFVDGDYTLSSL